MRRLLVLLLTGCALLVADGWVAAPPAAACSCVHRSTAAQLAAADSVFTGRLGSRTVLGGGSSDDPALHVFAVDSVRKGTAASTQTVVSAASSASCGLELTGAGPFVVFATRGADGTLSADLCGGTAPLTPSLDAELQALGGAPSPATGTEAAVPGGVGAGPVDAGMAAEPGSPSTALALEAGTALLVLLAGVLMIRRRRRTSVPATHD